MYKQNMKNKIDISIITLNYQEAALTKLLIESLLASEGVYYEIIVIDNSCKEKDKLLLSALKHKDVHVFFMNENLGCARGYNVGIGKARGKYIFILNNDTLIKDKMALSKMKQFMDNHKNVAAIQPKIKSFKNPAYYEYAGAAGGYLDILGYPFCRGRIFNTLEKDNGQYDDVVEITWASTCAFFAKKSILKRAGLFDPIYFAYAEEVDMSLKLWKMGYSILFFPDATVYHKGEVSWKKIRGRKTFFIHRNHLILYFKCLPLKYVLPFLPYRIFLELLSIIFYIFNKSVLHIIPIGFSYLSVVVLLPKIITKRLEFFQSGTINAPFYNGSIVFDYFVKKKKLFSDVNI